MMVFPPFWGTKSFGVQCLFFFLSFFVCFFLFKRKKTFEVLSLVLLKVDDSIGKISAKLVSIKRRKKKRKKKKKKKCKYQ